MNRNPNGGTLLENNEKKTEQMRVDQVVKRIDKKIISTDEELNRAHAETKKVQQTYSDNTSVNYFEVDDRIETSAELQQQRGLVSRLTENESILKNQLSTLKDLKKSPYFGRIDIQDQGDTEPEKLYIGIASFENEDGEFLVYDWRAPISSVYYNGTLGEVSYQTPIGEQKTTLKKKRQFQIVDGQIRNMFDTNETVGDEMLQSALGEQTDQYMQNIVATIQHEQNDIIRDTTSNLLVVQGVAGSGKTSAILQRIAFLLYHSRDTLEADQIILFSPNKLFSHYISEVLPSLGERNMRQVTFDEFIDNRLKGLNVQSLFERYETDGTLTEQQRYVRAFKESAKFMDELQEYCDNLSSSQIFFSDIIFNDTPFFTKKEISRIFDSFPKAAKIYDRFLQTKNALIKQLKRRIDDETKATWVNDEIDQLSNEKYHDLLSGKALGEFQNEDDERFYIARKIVASRLRVVYDAIFNDNFFDAYLQYADFLKTVDLPQNIKQPQWQQTIDEFSQSIEFHSIKLDDCAPLLYMRDYMCNSGQNNTMKYLFVDEMQDYSVAQLKYLRYAFPQTKWTLLGDSEQALFKDVEQPEEILNKLNSAFHVRRSRLISLMRSYRSTLPITDFAKSILPNGDDIQAFNRPGDIPELILATDFTDGIKQLERVITKQRKHYQTVAVLTKNMTEAEQVYKQLHAKGDVTLLKDADRTLPSGLLVLPIYLAKGLEFDSVIAWDTSEKNYPDENLLGTLYTIITRAMHHLTLISLGDVTPIIANSTLSNSKIKIEKKIQK
ncbi:superfamily I DNA RNA helicase [Lentilactobacillus parabuchneri DSM 5707 = NBRC 107865]|jgi:DNA helicase IV|uniref:Superfamily I DNA RNA helicase n=2 Tax=Lentilactobacillus parabuchneri TaxID=152331 RepID=A0A0R1YUE9_9LACO|nr:superfamily I DNA RNA helicase [Lentilactobacillus parabuchneri DSM 5707 = NBRC 107865]KRN80807.1 superfamily I DNA RNA helicase [Lentilactobacillus parabuchneri]